MISSPKQPPPDPQITAQALSAEAQQQQAVQASLSSDTLNMLRLFGQQNALSGAGITGPMSALIGSARPAGVTTGAVR
jgi:hypothetical protein